MRKACFDSTEKEIDCFQLNNIHQFVWFPVHLCICLICLTPMNAVWGSDKVHDNTSESVISKPVSYTHLDVYKRQRIHCLHRGWDSTWFTSSSWRRYVIGTPVNQYELHYTWITFIKMSPLHQNYFQKTRTVQEH